MLSFKMAFKQIKNCRIASFNCNEAKVMANGKSPRPSLALPDNGGRYIVGSKHTFLNIYISKL